MPVTLPRCTHCHQPILVRLREGHDALTPRQAEIYRWVRDEILSGRPAPTVREIGREFLIRSTNGVADTLKVLVRKGWLVPPPREQRTHGYSLPFEET